MSRQHSPIYLACLIVLCPGAAAFAQVAAPAAPAAPASSPSVTRPSVTTLPTVTVNGPLGVQRLADAPYAISVVDDEAIRSAGPMVNLSEALSRVPGLQIANRGNYAQDLQISSRGYGARAAFGVRGLRLYTDGIPASMPDGQGSVTHFDLASASRIEVLRGPYSVLYGSSSGGVIALTTDPATERQAGADVDIGSYGLRQERVRVDAPMGGGWDLRASASHFEIDGFRPHSAAKRDLANVRLGYSGASDKVVVIASNLVQNADDPLGLDRASLNANPKQTAPQALQFDTRKTARQTQLGLNWQHRFDGLGPLAQSTVTTWYGSRGVGQWQAIPVATQVPAQQAGGVVDFDRNYDGLDARLNWHWAALDLVTGVASEAQRENRRGFENFIGTGATQQLGVTGRLRRDEGDRVVTRDAYTQGDLKLTDTLGLTAGVRTGRIDFSAGDRFLSNGDQSGKSSYRYTTPVAGLHWKPLEPLTLHASVARGFESPTQAELAYRPDGQAGFNLGLQPQRSRQAELGARWSQTTVSGDLTVFKIDTSNEIGVLSNSAGRATYQNVGATERKGVEFALNWTPVERLKGLLSLTWLDATYRDGFGTCTVTPCPTPNARVPAGNRIAGTNPRSFYAEVAWQPLASQPTTVALELRGQGRTAVNDINSDYAAGFAQASLRGSHRWTLGPNGQKLELLARIDNITDRRYVGSVIVNDGNGRYFEPAPGRNGLLSLRYLAPF